MPTERKTALDLKVDKVLLRNKAILDSE